MKLILNYCTIADVLPVDPKKDDPQRKNRKVILHIDEEDFFAMLDSVNPKNIIKYLDMRFIHHREPLNINVTKEKVLLYGHVNHIYDRETRNLYYANKRNQRKLNRALALLAAIKGEKPENS